MDENLHLRRERIYNITATEMAILLGLNPYESPASLLEKKRNPQPITNNHVRRGKLKEPSVLEAFYLDMGMKTRRHFEGTLQLAGHRIAATPDAYVKNEDIVVECKSVTSRNIERWYDKVPDYYHLQVIVQMLVVGSSYGYIGALEEGDPYECEYRFVAWKIDRNERIIELLKQEVARFWELTDAGQLFRVKSAIKKEVSDLLSHNATMMFPLVRPVKEEVSYEEEISRALSLFQ